MGDAADFHPRPEGRGRLRRPPRRHRVHPSSRLRRTIRPDRLEGGLPQAPTRVLNTGHASRGCCGCVFLVTEDRADRFVTDPELGRQFAQRPVSRATADRRRLLRLKFARPRRVTGSPLGLAAHAARRGHGDDHDAVIVTQARDRSPSLPPDRRLTACCSLQNVTMLSCGVRAAYALSWLSTFVVNRYLSVAPRLNGPGRS